MWIYAQATGELRHDGDLIGTGYSGHGEGRNNPVMQSVPNIGPIPVGAYTIGISYLDPHLGPCVMKLEPNAGNNEFGRDLFRMHGNNIHNDASDGCIIMGPAIRATVSASLDRDLTVTP